MPKFKLLSAEEIDRSFAKTSRRDQREQEMQVYREAVQQLSDQTPGGVIELDEGDEQRAVMLRLHRAARDAGRNIRFQRSGKTSHELRFRLQTPEETERLKERGRNLAQSRHAKQQAELPIEAPKSGRRRGS